jgi:hypothetical protein
MGDLRALVDPTLPIAAMPLWLSGLLVIVIPTFVFMCGPVVVRRFVTFERLVINNEVAGFKFATLGVIYAVILGMAVISVWEKFGEAESASTEEAGALASIYRLTRSVDIVDQARVRGALTEYARSAIDDDWPAMARGRHSEVTLAKLTALYDVLAAATPDSPRGAVVLSAVLDQLDTITDARRDRLTLAQGVFPGVIWAVLIVGGIMTLGFTFFFALENLSAQALMTGMLALVITLALFVALTVDHAFTGPISVSPEALELVLEDFANGAPPS